MGLATILHRLDDALARSGISGRPGHHGPRYGGRWNWLSHGKPESGKYHEEEQGSAGRPMGSSLNDFGLQHDLVSSRPFAVV